MIMIDFLREHCSEIVEFLLLFMITLCQVIKYFKYSKEVNMKYRNENYKTGKKTPGQTFDTVVPEFKLDEKTNTLVTIGTKDLQELIQSSADCALKSILDKFGGVIPEGLLPVEPKIENETDEVNIVQIKDDFEALQEVLDFQEDIRARYKFNDGMTLDQMLREIHSMKSKLDKNIQDALIAQKGGVKNETEKKD